LATFTDIALHFFQSAVEIDRGLGVILMRMRHLPDPKSKGLRIFIVGAGRWVGLSLTASCAWGIAQECHKGDVSVCGDFWPKGGGLVWVELAAKADVQK
jgi:hypothetical protein